MEISVVFIMLGIIYLYFHNSYDTALQQQLYYLWDKGKDFLFSGSIYLALKGRLKKIFLIISICMLIRLVWQVLEIINYEYANSGEFLNWLFLISGISILCINIISIGDAKKQSKKNGRT